jgi:hypothetical protein
MDLGDMCRQNKRAWKMPNIILKKKYERERDRDREREREGGGGGDSENH